MKIALISATSLLALAASAQAYVLTPAPNETNLYDLVHIGDGSATQADPSTIAVTALRNADPNQSPASFTGPLDRSAAAGTAFPKVPLGAAPGTPPDEDFATQYTGAWHWNAWQRALAIGMARIAPLIGTIGNGSSANDKPGSTVFVAETRPVFDGASVAGSRRRNSGPSSTSTATITLTGPANIAPRAGSGFSVAAPADAQPQPAASQTAPADTQPPLPTYRYAPQPSPTARADLVAASFGDAITAAAAQPVIPGDGQPVGAPGRRHLQPDSEAAAVYARLIDVTQPIDGQSAPTGADGTRTFLPASVSADPTAAAARYVMRVLDAVPANPLALTVEVFQIGPAKGSATRVTEPLRGKVMAGAGPLDNSLALP